MNPKFSVLLPTKNRLELLRYAVETVRRQSYEDWEIVVSDNCSEDDIAGYVAALNEPRIRCVRAPQPLPVTENWNLALEHSRGDYVIMLGDDDGLLKGHLVEVARLVEQFDRPELLLTDAILYAYPNVIPGRTSGFLQIGYGVFFDGKKEPYLLDREAAEQAVRSSLNFRLAYQFNMQYSIVSRQLIERGRRYGPYFQSPYPDFYASSCNLLLSERTLVIPRPLVCIGISPKSFGYYYFNQRPEEGARFLSHMDDSDAWKRVRPHLLPGNELYSCWLAAVDTVRANIVRGSATGRRLKVAYERYRLIQLWFTLNRIPFSFSEWLRAYKSARWWERVLFKVLIALRERARRHPPSGLAARTLRAVERWMSPLPDRDTRVLEVSARNMLEVFETIAPEYY